MEVLMLSLWSNPLVTTKTKADTTLSPKSYFDRLFEDTFKTMTRDLLNIPTIEIGMETSKNEDGSLAISIDVPGVKEKDLTIEMHDNMLIVKGERKTATSSYRIHKSLTIPEGYDPDKCTAELKDGILSLCMAQKNPEPKHEVKKIPITTTK